MWELLPEFARPEALLGRQFLRNRNVPKSKAAGPVSAAASGTRTSVPTPPKTGPSIPTPPKSGGPVTEAPLLIKVMERDRKAGLSTCPSGRFPMA